NWPYGPPPDAVRPDLPTPDPWSPANHGQPEDNPCPEQGSIIACENQALGEAVDLTGAPIQLHYQSDRLPGRKQPYTKQIPVSGASLPASLRRIDLRIEVAGRRYTAAFAPAPGQSYTFTWDGKDAYGRAVQGAQPMTVYVGYVYSPVYYGVDAWLAAFGS